VFLNQPETDSHRPRPQLENNSPASLTGLSADATTAPVGINPECGITKAGVGGSLGNIANMIACGLSMIVVAFLIISTTRRRAAVGAFLSIPSRLGSSEALNVSPLLQVVRNSAFS